MMLAALDKMDSGLLSLLMAICGVAIMLMLLRRHQFRSISRRDVGREQLSRLRDQHRLQQSMDELLIQLEEVSRRVAAQVDTKYAILEKVIRDADGRIARLEQLLGHRSEEPPAHDPPKAVVSNPVASADPPPVEDKVDINAAPPSQNLTGEQAVASAPDNPLHQRLYELIDAGQTPIQAAEALKMPLGEVELILNLRRYR